MKRKRNSRFEKLDYERMLYCTVTFSTSVLWHIESVFHGLASRHCHNSLVVVFSVTSYLVVQYRNLNPQATKRLHKEPPSFHSQATRWLGGGPGGRAGPSGGKLP